MKLCVTGITLVKQKKYPKETVLVELWALQKLFYKDISLVFSKKRANFTHLSVEYTKCPVSIHFKLEVEVWTAYYSHEIDIVRIITRREGNFNELQLHAI